MGNFYEDNDDLRFYIERYIDWEPLVRLTERDFKLEDGFTSTAEAVEFYTDVLNLVGTFSADEIAPRAKEIDVQKPKVVDGEVVDGAAVTEIMEQIKELDLHGMCVPRELGGMNVPITVFMMGTELMSRADVSVCAHSGFHGGMAMAALMYSVMEGSTSFDEQTGQITETRFRQCIDEILSGETWGSMDITEPGAGSDMANLRCKGEQDADGNWFVTGQKIFITSGHGKWHFVIARTEVTDDTDAFAGLKGLSMFLVPAWSEDEAGNRIRHVTIDGVEDKLGHNGSATASISYERSPAHLLGKRGEGFKLMLLLMNNARVGVGFESLGLAEAAYRAALAYARERPSMGKTIDQHEMIADYLDEMRTDLQSIRALCVAGCLAEENSRKLDLLLKYYPPSDPEERKRLEKRQKRAQRKSREITPLVKYLASEKAVELSRRAIQIHGGCGYIKEYPVEKLLRDALVFPIYEGTSQIQALMAMKDTLLAAVKRPRRFLAKATAARWKATTSRDALEVRVAKLQTAKYGAVRFLLTRLAGTKVRELPRHPVGAWGEVLTGWDPKKDFALAMLHAERLTRILIDVAVAEELLEQCRRFPEREDVLVRWLERAEPRSRFLLDEITTTGLRVLETLNESAATEHAAK